MRSATFLASCALLALGTGIGLGVLSSSCSTLTLGTGGSGGAVGSGGSGGGIGTTLMPGEICTDPTSNLLQVRAMPSIVYLPTCPAGSTSCTTRAVTIVADPDTCAASAIHFKSAAPAIAPAPPDTSVSLHKDATVVTISAGATAGTTTIDVTLDAVGSMGPIGTATATLQVVVLDPTVPACSGTAQTPALSGGGSVTLGAASISLPVGASDPDQGSFLWGVPPFAATIGCAASDIVPSGYTKLGPPITFGPVTQTFQREVPLSVPINPGLIPPTARLRHVRLAYSGPAFLAPRTIPVADTAITQVNGAWALNFKAPRLGTYQAVVASDAGTTTIQRTMTYRAVMGISMGGGGAASFGFRHHDLFDVIAPLGGPVDWTWMLDYISNNQMGGFRSIPSGTTLADIQITPTPCSTNADCKTDETCVGALTSPVTQGQCLLMPAVTDPYAHPETYNTWWYEYPKAGNGGTFDRTTYTQIFRDLSVMFGNPNSENLTPGAQNLPAGVPPTDPSVIGTTGPQCGTYVDPVCPVAPAPTPWPNGAIVSSCQVNSDCGDGGQLCSNGMCGPACDLTAEQALSNNCPAQRCAHTLVLQNYYDATYNPDGIFPVITVCDGSPQNQALTPYADTWTSMGDGQPLEVALAVDYNGNGVRDALEPVIQSGHEPWDDFGTDGIPSNMEPGYMPGVNDDPDGDDYNAQYNPSGTENDHRYEEGEKFYDYGLDGVPNTPQQPPGGWMKPGDGYDVGEGDGVFTVSSGLQRFWDRDAHSIVRQMVDPSLVPGGVLDDGALARLDVWTDGGLRDLFNFEVDAQHLVGALYTRGRDATYLTGATEAPGLDPTNPDAYDPKLIDYSDLPGVVLQRYGEIDPSPTDIEDGSGQHVGTASELTARLQSALYFIGARWRNHPELSIQAQASSQNPAPNAPQCEVLGTCTISFTSAGGRTGPVGISLPPGYANAGLQNIRYPVIYLLHGYGQQPTDLEAAIVLLQNWMNSPLNSGVDRLPKAIVVYVDGRCRENPNGTSECIQGTFFADSPMPNGAQDETWWLELMNYIDQNYRTLGGDIQGWTE